MSPDTRMRALSLAAICFLILPGLLMVAGLPFSRHGLMDAFLDLGVMPFDGHQQVDTSASRLLTAILGGVLAGFGIVVLQVARMVYPRDPTLAASILVPAIMGWYVIDSVGSLVAGGWMNALLNTIYAVVLLVPLLWPVRHAASVGQSTLRKT